MDNRFQYFIISLCTAFMMGLSLMLLHSDAPFLALFPPFLLPALIFLCLRPEWGYYALIALIPFQTWEASITSMKFLSLSKFIGIIVFFIVIGRLVVKPERLSDFKSKIWFLMLLFLVIHLVATASSHHPVLLCLNSIRYLLTVYMFFFLTVYFLKTDQDIHRVLYTVVISVSLSASIGLVGHLFHIDALTVAGGPRIVGERVIGTANDPNFYALIIIVSLPLLAYLFFATKKWEVKIIYVIFFLQNFSVVILTYSRSAYLVLFTITMIIIIDNIRRFRPKYLGFYLLLAIFLAGFIAGSLPQTKAWKRLTSLTSARLDASLSRRASYIDVGWKAFERDPIIGAGPGTFPVVFSKSGVAAAFAESPRDYYRKAHDTYLEFLVGTGLSGLLCFMALLYISWKNFFSAQKRQKQVNIVFSSLIRAMMYAFTAIIIYQLFLSVPFFKYTWLFMGISISSVLTKNDFFGNTQKYRLH